MGGLGIIRLGAHLTVLVMCELPKGVTLQPASSRGELPEQGASGIGPP